jgi:hypothetical protein
MPTQGHSTHCTGIRRFSLAADFQHRLGTNIPSRIDLVKV